MKYVQPLGEAEGTAYTDGDPALAIPGSIPPAAAIEHPQREIVNVITAAGLTPDENDVGQLNTAIQGLVTSGTAAYAITDMSNVAATNVVDKIGAGDIVNSHLAAGSIGTAKVVDDAVTLGKLAHGTAGKVLGFDGSGAPTHIDLSSVHADLLDAFATKVLVDLNVTEASNSYGAYHLNDMAQGGMTITGGGMHVSGSGYAWGTEVNVALGASVTASSIYNAVDNQPTNVVDGSTSTFWMNAQGTWPHWLQLDLGQAYAGNRLEVVSGNSLQLGDFTALGSIDASNWTALGTGVGGPDGHIDTINLSNATPWRYIKINCTSPYAGESPNQEHYASISEVRLLQTSAAGQAVFTSSGVSLAKANPSDIALYALINEGGAVTEGTDRIFEVAEGSGGSLGTFITPTSILNLGDYLGQTLIRATFDVTSKPSSTYTYQIKLNNVEQTVSSAVMVPLYY